MNGFQAKIMEERLIPGVPSFQIITENEYRIYSPTSSTTRSPFLEEVFPCECRFRDDANDPEAHSCGERSSCINRSLSIECNAEDCPCRENCRNRRFQKHEYANVEVIEAAGKGFGLRTCKDLEAGQFIMEYVGEVLSQTQFEERAQLYTERGQKHYYFMTLQNDQVIDATKKGNLSRFMNHSCNPNCATQKWIVDGRLRVGLFTLRRVKAGSELTFDYKFIRFGAEAQSCLCGEANCKGVIGEEQRETSRPLVRTTLQEQNDAQQALEKFVGDSGVADCEDMALLARLLLRTEEIDSIHSLMQTLINTTNPVFLRRFLSLHGLQIINVLLGLHWRHTELLEKAVLVLEKLPIATRNALDDAHIEEKVIRLTQRDDLKPEVSDRCKSLLERWSGLETIFKIPRMAATSATIATLLPQIGIEKLTSSSTDSVQQALPAAGYSLVNDIDRYKKVRWSSSSLSNPAELPARRAQSPIKRRIEDCDLRKVDVDRHSYGEESRKGDRQKDESILQRENFGDSHDEIPAGWKIATMPDGRIYYYHESTRETRWDLSRRDKAELPIATHPYSTLSISKRERPKEDIKYDDRDRGQKMAKQQELVSGLAVTTTEDREQKLQAIIERAKTAALTRVSPVLNTSAKSHNSLTANRNTSGASQSSKSESRRISSTGDLDGKWQGFEVQLRDQVSQLVVKYVSRWCRSQINSSEQFKDLARRLTHGIVDKELRSLRKDHSTLPPTCAPLAVGSSTSIGIPRAKRTKIRNFLAYYLRDHGYRVDGFHDTTTSVPSSATFLSSSTSSNSTPGTNSSVQSRSDTNLQTDPQTNNV